MTAEAPMPAESPAAPERDTPESVRRLAQRLHTREPYKHPLQSAMELQGEEGAIGDWTIFLGQGDYPTLRQLADEARRMQDEAAAMLRRYADILARPAEPVGWAVDEIVRLFPGVDSQVVRAGLEMTDAQRRQPEWLWHEAEANHTQYGRWPRKPGTPYVRLDLAIAARVRACLEDAPPPAAEPAPSRVAEAAREAVAQWDAFEAAAPGDVVEERWAMWLSIEALRAALAAEEARHDPE